MGILMRRKLFAAEILLLAKLKVAIPLVNRCPNGQLPLGASWCATEPRSTSGATYPDAQSALHLMGSTLVNKTGIENI
jgi:hypothetical protein